MCHINSSLLLIITTMMIMMMIIKIRFFCFCFGFFSLVQNQLIIIAKRQSFFLFALPTINAYKNTYILLEFDLQCGVYFVVCECEYRFRFFLCVCEFCVYFAFVYFVSCSVSLLLLFFCSLLYFSFFCRWFSFLLCSLNKFVFSLFFSLSSLLFNILEMCFLLCEHRFCCYCCFILQLVN